MSYPTLQEHNSKGQPLVVELPRKARYLRRSWYASGLNEDLKEIHFMLPRASLKFLRPMFILKVMRLFNLMMIHNFHLHCWTSL
ncbi:hypothetical protein EUGRSUZ_C02066 [Eucalyptus grandis]|uniref:Uncharacterized protein n=2 Tax=Eucalyptus grandis TaxID=71139 RepID=A0ACC3LER1_EUCGR|nr:hypothetical protein EUGRSUZ_C02066 [Eucalyptus grandis]